MVKVYRKAQMASPPQGGNAAFEPVPVQRDHIGSLQRSLTPESVARAGYVSFCGAEMDFKTAPSIIDRARTLAASGLYGFTLPRDGYLEAIVWWMANARDWDIDPAWIVPAQGTIFAVATVIRMLTKPGDAIITQPPVYYRYEQAATRLGRRTVHNSLQRVGDRYRIDFDGLERLMENPSNKMLVLCNPHNPVGRVWARDDLERIGEIADRTDTVVVSDEIFAEVTFGDAVTTPYVSIPACARTGIVLTSLGKSFGLTGLNFANAIIVDDDLRARFTKQRTADHFGSIDPLAYASLKGAYCPEGLAWLNGMLAYVEDNVRRVRGTFEHELAPMRMLPVEGTYVGWIDWDGFGLTGDALERFLVDEALLALEPGEDFGDAWTGFSRMNLASTHEQIDAAMDRLVAAVKRFRMASCNGEHSDETSVAEERNMCG